jgi:hypothetical protein
MRADINAVVVLSERLPLRAFKLRIKLNVEKIVGYDLNRLDIQVSEKPLDEFSSKRLSLDQRFLISWEN